MWPIRSSTPHVSSGCLDLDDLLGGGLPRKKITLIEGELPKPLSWLHGKHFMSFKDLEYVQDTTQIASLIPDPDIASSVPGAAGKYNIAILVFAPVEGTWRGRADVIVTGVKIVGSQDTYRAEVLRHHKASVIGSVKVSSFKSE